MSKGLDLSGDFPVSTLPSVKTKQHCAILWYVKIYNLLTNL